MIDTNNNKHAPWRVCVAQAHKLYGHKLYGFSVPKYKNTSANHTTEDAMAALQQIVDADRLSMKEYDIKYGVGVDYDPHVIATKAMDKILINERIQIMTDLTHFTARKLKELNEVINFLPLFELSKLDRIALKWARGRITNSNPYLCNNLPWWGFVTRRKIRRSLGGEFTIDQVLISYGYYGFERRETLRIAWIDTLLEQG